MNTNNILFICGGAFDGLDKVIENRLGQSRLGFGAEVKTKKHREENVGKVLAQVLPEDLLKNGLIPEFIGRLPVTVTLDPLSEDMMIDILTQPKNALIKQYQRMMEMDGVKLSFEDDAVRLIAQEAMKHKTGARGLRAVLEKLLRNVMYEVPSIEGVTACRVTREVVTEHKDPVITIDPKKVKRAIAG